LGKNGRVAEAESSIHQRAVGLIPSVRRDKPDGSQHVAGRLMVVNKTPVGENFTDGREHITTVRTRTV